ncbi:MAG: DUF488 family protein [Candidatus Dormibacteria bacterium]
MASGGARPLLTLFTIGHGADSAEHFVGRCRAAQVESIVDVRTAPGSRRHPHFGRDAMAQWLPDGGLAYRWEPQLGGFRKPRADSRNTGLRHPAFRGFADYMETASFREAFDAVITEAGRRRTAAMCSETLWWRCHRRLIADAAMLLCPVDVLHVDGRGRTSPHRLTDGVERDNDHLRYVTAQSVLGL